jgi:hypothetical protein
MYDDTDEGVLRRILYKLRVYISRQRKRGHIVSSGWRGKEEKKKRERAVSSIYSRVLCPRSPTHTSHTGNALSDTVRGGQAAYLIRVCRRILKNL